MLRSSNPILSRQDAFTPAGQQSYGQASYAPGHQGTQPGYGGTGHPGSTESRMTFDDVISKSVITIGLVIAVGALTMYAWFSEALPESAMFPVLVGSGLIGLVAVLLVVFRRKVSPPLVIAYSLVEGVFVGTLSFVFEQYYEGIVVQAVIGTFAAAGVTLAAYKIFNIRVTPKFRKVVVLATIGFAVAILLNFMLNMFTGGTIDLGLRGGITGPVGLLPIAVSLLGAVLAVLNLVLDFDHIERGVAMGAPASESWRGAFGLTVTMVWLYIEILRLLSYLRR